MIRVLRNAVQWYRDRNRDELTVVLEHGIARFHGHLRYRPNGAVQFEVDAADVSALHSAIGVDVDRAVIEFRPNACHVDERPSGAIVVALATGIRPDGMAGDGSTALLYAEPAREVGDS